MEIKSYDNRTCVTFNVTGYGSEFALRYNAVTAIAKKHNAQQMLFTNKNYFTTNSKGNYSGDSFGDSGGTITFHSHSCNHKEAAQELITLLESFK